jgi:hypothetical protein
MTHGGTPIGADVGPDDAAGGWDTCSGRFKFTR